MQIACESELLRFPTISESTPDIDQFSFNTFAFGDIEHYAIEIQGAVIDAIPNRDFVAKPHHLPITREHAILVRHRLTTGVQLLQFSMYAGAIIEMDLL